MKRRKITELPAEMALRICEYFNAEDLVQTCNTIPNWRWILTSRRAIQAMRRHISNWRWLDKHLCCLLFSQTSPTADRNLPPAIQHHSKETEQLQQHSSRSCSFSPAHPINCCLLVNSHTLLFSLHSEHNYHRLIMRTIELNPFPRRGPHVLDMINLLQHYKRDDILCYHDFGERNFKGDVLSYDCYVFVMDPEFCAKNQLLHLLGLIEPHQILVIAILPRAQADSVNDMHVFAKFIASFDNFADCPLATTAVDWRLFCVKRLGTEEVNLNECLRFVHYDLHFKGIGCTRKDGGTLS